MSLPKKDLSQKNVLELFIYDFMNGTLIWKKSFKNGIYKKAGSIKKDGYIRIKIKGKLYSAHRIIWLYVYGYHPENQIDHIDRNRHNNKLNNLREVSPQCNNRNSSTYKNNKSGIVGVCWDKSKNKWCSHIAVNNKRIRLGLYENKYEAVLKRWIAEKKYNFPNCCINSTSYKYLIDKKII